MSNTTESTNTPSRFDLRKAPLTWWVRVVRKSDSAVVKEIPTQSAADSFRVERGLQINLDRKHYRISIGKY